MRTVNLSQLQAKVATLATCWEIIRQDGFALRFTDHDRNLLVNSKWYYAANTIRASALMLEQGVGVRDRDLEGAITSDLITDEDLHAGLYQDARVNEFVCDWTDPEEMLGISYWIKDVTYDGDRWKATVSNAASWLQSNVGIVLTKKCRHSFGDKWCGVVEAGTAVDIVTHTGHVIELDASATTGMYDNGTIEFANGYIAEIRANVGDVFTLWLDVPFTATGSVTLKRGCNKSIENCVTPWNNLVNFGGVPFIPGNDKMLRTPDSRQ